MPIKLKEKLVKKFPNAIRKVIEFRSEFTFLIEKESIQEICTYLKLYCGFDYCVDICGVDRFSEGEERFEVIYNLLNLSESLRVRLKVRIDEDDLFVDTVTNIWDSANWHERETYDMFGVKFRKHPDLRRMYMPEDFEYYPLRKEFPLIGIQGSIPLPSREKNEIFN